jgi:hypothetical protein
MYSQYIYLTQIIVIWLAVRDYRRRMDWRLDLFTTYTHHSELHVITALSLIYTLHKSLLQTLSLLLNIRSLATALTVVFLQLPVLRSFLSGEHPATELSQFPVH